MSGLRLRETFNRLLQNQFTSYLKKGVAGLLVAATVALPAAAHHNDNNDLRPQESNTRNSRELRSIQQQFNRAVTDRNIILMDRDWIEINRALNDVRNNEALRNRYLAEYLARAGRLHITPDYFKSTTDSAIVNPHSQLVQATTADGAALRVCIVFGGQDDLDIESRVRDFIDVSRAVHGNAVRDASVTVSTTPERFRQYVNYHEIGHCMDDWYLPAMKGDFSQDPAAFFLLYHRAESFADVYGALLMAREKGVTNIAGEAANIRLANGALAGPFQVRWSQPTSTSHYASFIYATHRSLRAAQEHVDRHGAASLQAMSYQEIAVLAHEIVDRTALNKMEFETLMALYATKFDRNVWDQLRETTPFIADRYAYAQQLRGEIEQGLRAVLDLRHLPPGADALAAIPYSGTPVDYVREMQQKAGTPAAQAVRAQALAARLYAQAGGSRANMDDLLRVFTENKDRWRATLASGNAAERKQAMDNLAVAGKALWLAAHRVRGTDPNAVNDNRAEPQNAPVPKNGP